MSDIKSNVDEIFNELNIQMDDLNEIVSDINDLLCDNTFKYISKTTRNLLLDKLMEKSGSVEDSSRALIKSLKKIKRIRMPENVSDSIIMGSDYYTNQVLTSVDVVEDSNELAEDYLE